MTATTIKQYRPISSLETAEDDSLSVRAVRDTAANINNCVLYVFRHSILGLPCIPVWQSHNSTADERVISMMVGIHIPEPYDKLAWTVGNKRTAGSANITWKLYADEYLYKGDGTLDSTKQSPRVESGSIVCSSGTHDVPACASVDVVRGSRGWCWLMLTATNGDASTRGYISSFTIFPYLSV